jgi:serine/threonine protein kinase
MSKVTDLNDCGGPHNTETTGTLQYMAPESMGSSAYSTATDIYSFGIIMWEFLVEREAYEGLEGFQLIDSVVTKRHRPKINKAISD